MGLNDGGTSYIELRAKMDQLKRDVSTAGAMVDKQMMSQTQKLGSKMGNWTKNHWRGIAQTGGAVLAAGAAASIKEFIDAEKVAAQTAAAIKSTGGAAGVTGEQIAGLAEQLMMKSGVDDETIASGENLLLTFTNIRNEVGKGNDIFSQATETMLDMSVALGQDSKSSAIQLGKALNDPVKGVSALQRVGVAFTDGQRASIEAMVASGDTMKAQKVILKELRKEFGGSAEAAGKTLGGALNRLKESAMNAGGALAENFAPEIQSTVESLQDYANLVSEAGKSTERAAESNQASIDLMMQLRESYEQGTITQERYASGIQALLDDETLSTTQRASLVEVTRILNEAERRGIDLTNQHSEAYNRNHIEIMGVSTALEGLIADMHNVPSNLGVSYTAPSTARARTRSTGSGKGGLADGGPVQPFRAYMVGERGPEMFVSDVPGRVIPNHQLGGGGHITGTLVIPGLGTAILTGAQFTSDAGARREGRIGRTRRAA